MRYQILTPGAKIKKLRKEVGAKQTDITGNQVSRETISLIENNKITLIYDTAKIISDSFNKMIIGMNLNMHLITPEYLCQDIEYQVNDICDKYISELDDIKFSRDFEDLKEIKSEIEMFLGIHSMYIYPEKRIKLYYLIAEDLFRLRKYEESLEYAGRCEDIAAKMADIYTMLKLHSLKIRVCWVLERMKELLSYSRSALYMAELHNIQDKNILKVIYYNTALAYRKFKNNNECIRYCDKFINTTNDANEKINARILIANCYLETKDYNLAEKLYLNILEEAKNCDNNISVARAYRNLALVCIGLGDKEQAETYTEKLLKVDCISFEENTLSLYYAVHSYKELDMLSIVQRYLYRTLAQLEKVSHASKICNLILDVFDYFVMNKSTDDIQKIIEFIDKSVSKGIYNGVSLERLIKIVYKAAGYFEKINYHEKFISTYNIANRLDSNYTTNIEF